MNEQDYVFVYTRQQAIEDGIFVDVSEVAQRNGFNIPVALTTNLFHQHIKGESDQDTDNRLNVFLRIMHENIRTHKDKTTDTLLTTKVYFDDKTPTDVWVAIEGQSPSDPSPALNIMLPEDY